MDFEDRKEIKFENNPTRSEERDELRQLLADRTEAFIAAGGQVQQVGHQMREPSNKFTVSPAKATPLERLLGKPTTTRPQAMPKPLTAQAKPQRPQPAQLLPTDQLAARLMAQAALGASPSAAAKAIGITEKQARQIARDFHINFTRQR
ncbi:hypothetical protein [Pseudomonas sichuanensis]|uniref:hypothetical protein n=1 Tax=Pseudomonas sichuanensis TaxID=2213015 RepID=UPI000DA6C0BB|nr:hypothetical protein [Pseudomonas sichuanensis]